MNFFFANFGTNLDPLYGQASFASLFLYDMLSDNLGKGFQVSWDDLTLDTLAKLFFVFGLFLTGDTLALFLNHVGIGGKSRTHHAHLRTLEIGSIFMVQVTAKSTSPGFEKLRSRNFNTFSIKEDQKT